MSLLLSTGYAAEACIHIRLKAVTDGYDLKMVMKKELHNHAQLNH